MDEPDTAQKTRSTDGDGHRENMQHAYDESHAPFRSIFCERFVGHRWYVEKQTEMMISNDRIATDALNA